MRYVSFIHRDKAGYGVSFPDFPGCVSVGDTANDAIRHGREALAFHVEGLAEDSEANPEPRTIDAIEADPELADWCREADLVLIPLLLDRGSSRRVNISLAEGVFPRPPPQSGSRRDPDAAPEFCRSTGARAGRPVEAAPGPRRWLARSTTG